MTTKNLDVRANHRAWIGGPPGIDVILRSLLYRALTADGDDIEVWLENSDHSLPYFWLVSQADGFPRRLALVRFNSNTGELQERIKGPFGTEIWADVPWERWPEEADKAVIVPISDGNGSSQTSAEKQPP